MNEVLLKSVLPELGKTIRLFREKSGRNLGIVAGKAGISISMLSQIERGMVSPSIDTLCLVCKALDLDVAELFRRLSQEDPVRVHRQGERLTMKQDGVSYEQLMTSQTSRFPAEMFLIEVAEAESTMMSGGGHEGVEIGYVLAGDARLEAGGSSYEIHEGDSIYFEARLPHRLINTGKGVFKAVWSISPPHVDYLKNS
jgi:transcriptional regulator with XRE-family HTH domain